MSNFLPETLQEAVIYFAEPDNCLTFIIAMRWPSRMACVHCGDIDVTFIERKTRKQTRPIWQCNGCKKQFSVTVGTIFEDSHLPLGKWLTAMWLLTGAKNGISSCELARALGITQKSAWFMLHRIREAIRIGSIEKMRGPVESDETYVGGLEKFKHRNKRLHGGTGGAGKTIVQGIVERAKPERKSRIKAEIICDTSSRTLHGKLAEHVERGATVYTDTHRGYQGLNKIFAHEFVDHTVTYAQGAIHTNSAENFWSLLKRMLKGTYVAVEPYHLSRYVDEMAFRFNERGGTDQERFLMAASMIVGKKLTYAELTSAYETYYQQVMPR